MSTAVAILVQAKGATGPLRKCLNSLVKFAPAECALAVLDSSAGDSGIRDICEQMKSSLPQLRYVHNPVKRDFSEACGAASSDVLLLDSNAEVTAGFWEELHAVLYLHERHGVVSPRGNDAGVFSIPPAEADLDADTAYEAWQRVKPFLPRYQVMPTAAGFCLLIKAEIRKWFPSLDEDVDDFICRINRCGYSAVAANWVYVFQHQLEETPAALERPQYPEYERKLAEYKQIHANPLERFAALHAPHKPRILFDLFHLTATHSGTSDFGLNLLRELARTVEGEFDLFVGMREAERLFANELVGYRFYDDQLGDPAPFDLVFKPCQVTSWAEFRRMHRAAPRISYTLLDIIGVRCEYMNSPGRQIVLQKTASLADCVFSISEFAHTDFEAFYQTDLSMRVIHLGSNAGMTEGEFRQGDYVLLMGNGFAHKGVRDAVRQFSNPDLPLVVLGGEKPEEPLSPNIRWLSSGGLSRQHIRELFTSARVLVYPSYYEGFGLPVVDALALGKPVVVLDSAMNRELAAAIPHAKLHILQSMNELQATAAKLFEVAFVKPTEAPRRWSDVASDYAQAFRKILSDKIDAAKIQARWEMLRTLDSADYR